MSDISTSDLKSVASARNGAGVIVIICLIVVVSVLLYGAVDTGTLAVLSFLSMLLVTYWSWISWKERELTISTQSIQIPVLALAVVGLIQLLPFGGSSAPVGVLDIPAAAAISLDPYATRFFLMRLFLCLVFFAASLTFINSISRMRSIVFLIVSFGGLLAFYSILQRVEDPSSIYGLRQPGQAIPFGTFINRHHFAALMEMTLGLSLGVLLAGNLKRNRWPFVVAAAVVMAIAIILTGSRGGVIGLITSLIAIAAFTAIGRDRKKIEERKKLGSPVLVLTAGSAFLLLTVALVVFLGGVDPLLRGTGIGEGAGDFTSGRIDFWSAAIKIFLDHPIIGVGLDAFGAAYSGYDTSSGLLRIEQAHNDYLQTLADAGVAGFACVAAFIYLLLGKGIGVIRNSSPGFRRGAAVGALAGCVGILVHSLFDFPLRTPANAFVFLLLAALSVVEIPDETPHRRHRPRSTSAELA